MSKKIITVRSLNYGGPHGEMSKNLISSLAFAVGAHVGKNNSMSHDEIYVLTIWGSNRQMNFINDILYDIRHFKTVKGLNDYQWDARPLDLSQIEEIFEENQ